MPEARKCPRCRATLRADAPHGLCPGCLLHQAMASDETPVSAVDPNREVVMIAFTCSHCGLKLKVKPEFAGRSSRCPTCKQSLVVPAPSLTQAEVAAGPIDGTDSRLAKA